MADPEDIYHFRRLSAEITTSGQPSEDQLKAIAALGVTHVINLGMHDHERALANEAASVSALGMDYIHIPVEFDAPTDAHFARFCDEMEKLNGQTIHVHCIANLRVTAFLYRYQRDMLGVPEADARELMDSVWRPGGVWAGFIGDEASIELEHRPPLTPNRIAECTEREIEILDALCGMVGQYCDIEKSEMDIVFDVYAKDSNGTSNTVRATELLEKYRLLSDALPALELGRLKLTLFEQRILTALILLTEFCLRRGQHLDHICMMAGEGAFAVLEKYNLLHQDEWSDLGKVVLGPYLGGSSQGLVGPASEYIQQINTSVISEGGRST